jgi:hypothetical protein
MPLSAITFFRYMLEKRERDFQDAISDMGMNGKSKTVKDFHRSSHYVLPVSFITLICLIGVAYIIFADQFVGTLQDSVLLAGSEFGTSTSNAGLMARSLVAASFAFMGGFLWSATNIIRRLIAYDLSPYVYYSAGIRIILAALVSVVLAFIIGGTIGNGLPAIALLAGMFPERVLNFLVEKYKDIIGARTELEKDLSLDNVEGVSLSHKERLAEVGVDNAQNLASFSLVHLLKKTPFETRQVLDWIGQCKLLINVRGEMEAYRNMGIRSAFDLFKGDKTKESFSAAAAQKGVDPIQAGFIFEQIVNDPGIQALANFENQMNLPSGKEEESES